MIYTDYIIIWCFLATIVSVIASIKFKVSQLHPVMQFTYWTIWILLPLRIVYILLIIVYAKIKTNKSWSHLIKLSWQCTIAEYKGDFDYE